MAEKKQKQETETIIVEAVLKSAFTHEDAKSDKITNVIRLEPDAESTPDIWEVLGKMYENTADKWIPQWFKDHSGITLKSAYNIPVKIDDENAPDLREIRAKSPKRIIKFSEFVERGFIAGAHVKVQCNIKDSALYPKALLIIKDGEEYDPFADF